MAKEVIGKPMKKYFVETFFGKITEIIADSIYQDGDYLLFYVNKEIIAQYRDWVGYREVNYDKAGLEEKKGEKQL